VLRATCRSGGDAWTFEPRRLSHSSPRKKLFGGGFWAQCSLFFVFFVFFFFVFFFFSFCFQFAASGPHRGIPLFAGRIASLQNAPALQFNSKLFRCPLHFAVAVIANRTTQSFPSLLLGPAN